MKTKTVHLKTLTEFITYHQRTNLNKILYFYINQNKPTYLMSSEVGSFTLDVVRFTP